MPKIDDLLESAFCEITRAIRAQGYRLANTYMKRIDHVSELDHRAFGIMARKNVEPLRFLGIDLRNPQEESYVCVGTVRISDSPKELDAELAHEWVLDMRDSGYKNALESILRPISATYETELTILLQGRPMEENGHI